MYKFFRDNQKKLLAIFGVVLMIAFVMPTTMKNPNGPDPQRVEGMIGLDKITLDQTRAAEDEWHYLAQRVMVHANMGGQQQWVPVTQALLPSEVSAEMQANPNTYFLLQYEARKMGMVPQYQDAADFLVNDQVGIRTSNGAVVALESLNDNATRTIAGQYMANLLMVTSAFQRVANSVKVSDPLVQHQIAEQSQQIKVRVVDFAAKNYEAKVGAPTDEQLAKHFEAYADVVEGAPATEKDPFGFGYKYPNRIKIQYLIIPRAEVRKAIKAGQSDYDWQVRAQRYYIEHQKDFITTTQASNTSGLSLGVAAPITSTTKPFEEVQDEVMNRIIEPLVDALQTRIQTDLSARMAADYEAWLKANPNGPATAPATQEAAVPTTAPATSAPAITNAPFRSYEYLQKLAGDVLRQYKVTLTIGSATDSFKDMLELQALPGIGSVSFDTPQQSNVDPSSFTRISFAQYALTVAEPFVPADQRDKPVVLSLYEPSRPLLDDSRNGYVFRITAADPSHKPASFNEVRPQVEMDWKRAQAYQLAKEDAQKLLEAARAEEIEKVAGDHKVIQTDEYFMQSRAIGNYLVTSASLPEFIKQTFAMITPLLSHQSERPVTLVEMPADGKVAVAELVYVDSTIKDEMQQIAREFFGRQIQQQYQLALADAWFNHDNLVARLNYQDQTRPSQTSGGAPEPASD
jgi:hypothetical protein